MEKYGKILLFVMPIFFTFILLEKLYGRYIKKEKVNNMDTVSSLTSGITMITKNVLGLSITIISYSWIEEKIALTHIATNWLTYVIAFVAIDFSHYWIHRIDHANNFFWNSHIVHHSSEEFDLACAVRQPISSFVKIFSIFMIPAALLGISPLVVATVTPIQFFAQFWYHTRYINRMGFLEKIIVTPSHHRVHHAFNNEYLDKNLAQIFIIWDKMFGTFMEERSDIPPVYGITRPMRTWNPIRINFIHMWLLITDAWRANSFVDKIRVWSKPTGWRPADVAAKNPVFKIDDVYRFDKYTTSENPIFISWIWMQLVIIFFGVAFMLGNIANIGLPNMFIYGAFIFVYVYALTDLMDGSKYAFVWEILKCLFGLGILYFIGDWFGASKHIAQLNFILVAYFILSLVVTIRLNRSEKEFALAKNGAI
ncbi:MAG: sterol desaturase family protein [Bacteroidetes bacterium]|nr:sterol desaturase family protein [Bacteroidota bacterium]